MKLQNYIQFFKSGHIKHKFVWTGHDKGIDGYCPFEWDAPTETNLAYVALILNVGIDQLGAADNQAPGYERPLPWESSKSIKSKSSTCSSEI